jgi:hypothetical protein
MVRVFNGTGLVLWPIDQVWIGERLLIRARANRWPIGVWIMRSVAISWL